MAATRKLQGEIDRCLKKVTEGVETFEDIWQKVHNATNSNQKEKYEADLKKEIKKLQRLRDQIKSWIASGEIKDKSTLLDYRKLIETQMERFKVVERETKTKAYSKEGLGAAQKLDPAQKERDEISSWLVSSIDALNLQVDQFESEIESLLIGKKKRLDKEKQDRMEELKTKLDKHRFHIKKLETLLRMLDNMSVEVDQIRRIKEDVEYYIDSSQEPGFEENEYIYDDIRGLDEIELSGVGLPSSGTTDSNDSAGSPTSILSGTSPAPSPILELHNHSTDSVESSDKKKKEDVIIAKPVKPMAVRAVVNNTSMNTLTTNNNNNGTSSVNSTNVSSLLNSSAASINSVSTSSTPSKVSTAPLPSPPLHRNVYTPEVVENGPTSLVNCIQLHNNSNSASSTANSTSVTGITALLQQQCSAANNTLLISNSVLTASITHQQSLTTSKPEAQSPITVNGPSLHHTHTQHTRSESEGGSASSLKSIAQDAVQRAGLHSPSTQQLSGSSNGYAEAHIPPLLGVAPLGPAPLRKEHQLQFQMMEAGYYHMPHPSDSERPRHYLPRNVCQTPPYYAQSLPPAADTVEFFQRLSTETLFFIFYYMEGTKAQYLAAKALKKQSWRFHTKYMMWFQRHEEPKIINEEYEQGTYIYFDYEKWGQRKKEGFTFEYKYLEDRELN